MSSPWFKQTHAEPGRVIARQQPEETEVEKACASSRGGTIARHYIVRRERHVAFRDHAGEGSS